MVRGVDPDTPLVVPSPGSGAVWALLTTVLATGLATLPAAGQNLFGQNKIQYSDFQWRVMHTPHVDLHFYPEEEEVARWVADVVEEASEEFLTALDLELPKPIPFLLYSNHHDFKQTNASPFLISEEVGGLTELIKGRVLVPHNGSYHMLRWVVRHELVHAFMLEKLTQVLREHRKTRYTYPPLWYIEGLAEFLAAEWDSRADMILRDAVLGEHLVPIQDLWRINGTFQMYKQGQSILLYIEREFGRDKVLRYLEEWWQGKTFAALTQEILGVTLDDLNRAWTDDLKRRYFPQVRDRDRIGLSAHRLVERGRFNLKPCPLPGGVELPEPEIARGDTVPTPDGEETEHTPGIAYDFVFLSSYEGFTNIRLSRKQPGVRPGDGPEPRLLVKGGTSETFESLHFFQSAIDANSRREIVFVSKKGARDVLHLYDVDRRRLVRTLAFPGLVGLKSPGWSPDGAAIVFSGVDASGHRDLYTVERSGKGLSRLTDDHFDDLDPDWSPDGRWIVFSSDRCPGGEAGHSNLYLYDLEGQALLPLTRGAHEDATPAWSPDGRLVAFRSNRDQGVYDLHVTDLGGEVRSVARFQTAILDPEWTPDGKGLVCTSFVDQRFAVFEVTLDEDRLPVPVVETAPASTVAPAPAPPPEPRWEPDLPDTSYHVADYRRRFGLDLVTGGVAYDPEFGGGGGGGQIVLSDLLGNERIFFFVANDGGRGAGILESFDLGFSYFNLARRLNWGAGAFRLTRVYDPELDAFRREARVGGLLVASYPLSRFNRFETSLVLRKVYNRLYRIGEVDDTILLSNFFSYVHDATLWNRLGPFDGSRYNLTVGQTTDIGAGLGDYTSLLIDYRHYRRLLPTMNLAFRALGRFSFGEEGQRYVIGGAHTLRGYPRRAVLGQRLVLLNHEVRFPVIERLLLRLPVGLVDLPVLNGSAFFDVAWSGDPDWRPGALGSLGLGLYVGGGGFPRLRVDFARRTDFRTLAPGTDTEFSIGFNY